MDTSNKHPSQSETPLSKVMSLKSLPGLRQPGNEGSGSDDCDSQCSYYSLSELPETDPVRRVPAAKARRQAIAMPAQPRLGCKYPETFDNVEKIPLRVSGPWVEYPLLASTPYTSGIPGPARVIVSAHDYAGCDVIYHPRKELRLFVYAKYRPRAYHRELSKCFASEYGPVDPSAPMNPYHMHSQMEQTASQGSEWYGQGFNYAPWQAASYMPTQSDYGIHQFQPLYGETYNPYVDPFTSYHSFQNSFVNFPVVESR